MVLYSVLFCISPNPLSEDLYWLNQCVQNVIRVEKVLEIWCKGLGKTIRLKTQDEVASKESKYSEAGRLITLWFFFKYFSNQDFKVGSILGCVNIRRL